MRSCGCRSGIGWVRDICNGIFEAEGISLDGFEGLRSTSAEGDVDEVVDVKEWIIYPGHSFRASDVISSMTRLRARGSITRSFQPITCLARDRETYRRYRRERYDHRLRTASNASDLDVE